MVGRGSRAGGLATGCVFELGISEFRTANPTHGHKPVFLGMQGPCDEYLWKEAYGDDFVTEELYAKGHDPSTCLIDPLSRRDSQGNLNIIDLWEHGSEFDQIESAPVNYPDMNRHWSAVVPGSKGASKGQDERIFGGILLNPACTHLLLCNDVTREKLRDFLEYVVPSVHVLVASKNEFSLGFALQKAARGATVIVMQNTGIWANFLAKEVMEYKQQFEKARRVEVLSEKTPGVQIKMNDQTGRCDKFTCPSGRVYDKADAQVLWNGRYPLPRDARCDRCMVFNAFQDTADTVVEKLTLTLNTIMGDDLQVLGFAKSEVTRLRTAWMMERRFRRSAKQLKVWARVWHYSICIMSFITTVVSVILSLSSMGPNTNSSLPERYQFRPHIDCSAQNTLAMFCGILPLVSTFLISGNARFCPYSKYTSLVGAAAETKKAIFQYGARVLEYRSTRTKGSILIKLRLQSQAGSGVILKANSRRPSKGAVLQPGLANEATVGDLSSGQLSTLSAAPDASLPQAGNSARVVPGTCQQSNTPKVDIAPSGQQSSPSQRLIEVLTDIQTQVMAGDNKVGCLIEPNEQEWHAEVERKHAKILKNAFEDKEKSARKIAAHHKNQGKHLSRPRRVSFPGKAPRVLPEAGIEPDSPIRAKDGEPHAEVLTGIQDSEDPENSLDDWKDDLCSLLSAEQYVQFRIIPALEKLKSPYSPRGLPRLTKVWSICQTCLLLGTMATGVLGVLGMLELIPVLLTAMSAVESAISFEQLQLRLVTTNQALQTLQRLMIWWNGLSMVEQRKLYNKEHLISQTEAVVNIEANIFGMPALSSHPSHATDDADAGADSTDQKKPVGK